MPRPSDSVSRDRRNSANQRRASRQDKVRRDIETLEGSNRYRYNTADSTITQQISPELSSTQSQPQTELKANEVTAHNWKQHDPILGCLDEGGTFIIDFIKCILRSTVCCLLYTSPSPRDS